MSQPPSIAIIGGGPGGLTLARILALHDIPATVFEADAHPLARPQGGSLDMHPHTGQHALRLADLECEFLQLARYGDQGGKVYHPNGELLFEDSNPHGNRPEIDRTQLRQLLLDALSAGTVRWNQKVRTVRPLDDGRYAVMANGTPGEAFDLVVGADGAWSRVRPLLSDAEPFYEGVMVAELGIDDVDGANRAIGALVGHGKMFAKGRARLLAGQRNDNAHIRIYAAFRAPESAVVLDTTRPAEAKIELAKLFADFAPKFLNLIATGTLLAVRPLYAMPIGHSWSNRPGVTLLGDAAHLMSPFGGEGANGAMADASDLAMALIRHGDWRQAVAEYETTMFPRAEEAAQGASDGLRGAVAEDALSHVLEHFTAARDRARSDAPRQLDVPTPKGLFETRLAQKTKNSSIQKTLNATYRFDLSGPTGGSWIVDFKEASAGVREGDGPCQCTVSMTDNDFVEILTGALDPRRAFTSGRLKVQGDMSLAMKISNILTP
ncbi:FAD-dependent oxidoreductase [Kaistia sp. 32K]|uniref:SCP2 sterol-binding domain-containing protein n=1 Tax=Kaistia sp. 32K TaxID=2795690 RepID=UPI00191678F6|nr:SCP2 sterol-binding domain-containing protein [Kaistia sp. 32K]BCP54877.1 FAD-dependent oxidoreductase [Kaistia sp. 32K]